MTALLIILASLFYIAGFSANYIKLVPYFYKKGMKYHSNEEKCKCSERGKKTVKKFARRDAAGYSLLCSLIWPSFGVGWIICGIGWVVKRVFGPIHQRAFKPIDDEETLLRLKADMKKEREKLIKIEKL